MKNMKIFKYIFLSLIVASEGVIKFHENLSEDHLTHYFGTKSIHDVPAYEFTNPTEVTSRTSPNNHAPQYAIRAFNTDYHISLQKNQHLISPGCLVLKQQKNGTNEVSACSQGEHHDCYYHGHVVNHANSSVAVSTCTGLHGIIHMVDHDLVLQPIRREHVNHVQRSVNEALPHIVYKRQPATSATCGKSEPVFVPIPSKRRKRATGDKHYMQLRIVMAPDSTHFHGDDAKRYALTALNIAALRFKDPSLGHEILTAVIEILLLQGDQPELSLVDDSEQLLNSFCFWDEKRQPRSKEDDHFADGAMLITKMNLKYKNDPTNLGLGHVGGMCKANYRCSVNEDNGLDLGLTIAHETGHMLGMVHDGENNNCTTGINIMSGKGGSGLASTQWSRCSKAYLDTFLSSSVSNCLNDVPIPWEFQLMNSASKPGIIYSGNEQCRMAMDDPNSKLCEGTQLTSGNECKMLVCYGPVVPNHAQSCYRGGPVRLDGTECGHRNWCIGGECVAMGPDAPAAINGGWSAWDSDWTPCSRSCGGGVHVKTRKCNNPEPRFGGSTCPGSTIQAKLCNIESCPVHSKYRAEQCTATNAIPLQEKQYNWIPYNDDLCSLRCYDEYASIVDYRGDKYVDGTECQAPGPFSRCVAGKCRKFGCDGHLDSVRVFDKCGVCGGQSTTCTPHRGTYNQGRAKAYVTVITIPRGSTGVVVTNANKYCHMSVKIAGSLLFSQGTSISLSGKYVSNGVAVQYRRSSPERITIAGPTPVVLKLQVWRDYGDEYEDVKPQISYIYYTPIQQPYSDYTWRTTQGTCSQTCGTGHAIVNVQCVHKSTNTAVEDYHCDIYSQPRENVQQCNTKACPPEWNSEKWTSCSKSCGRGKQSRLVHCVIIQRDSHVITNDNQCSPAHKPAVSRRCNTQPCPGSWTPGAWSTCSLTCGRGSQTRTVNCYDAERSTVIVNDIRCDPHEKPIGHQHCILKPCNLAIGSHSAVATTAKPSDNSAGCSDQMDCSSYQGDICTNTAYNEWAKSNCAKFCKLCSGSGGTEAGHTQTTAHPSSRCSDKLADCHSYQADTCTNSDFQSWARQNCAKHCGLCKVCSDKLSDCPGYGKDMCTNPSYQSWAFSNCASFCGLCDQVRRKRSISKLATTLKHALVPSRLPQPIVPPMEPGNLVPEFLSPEHSLRVPKPGKPLQQIFPEQQFEVEDVVPTPRKEVMEPVAILQIPKIVTDIQRVIQKNSQALVFPATGSQLVPNQNVAADIPVVVEQVPMVTSDQADLPPIEPGQIFVSVPAPKINLDQVPPRKTSEVKDDDVSVSDQHEMGSKVEDQQEMGSKVEDQQEMGSKVEDQHEVGSKIEGQQEMRLKEEDQQKMGSKIEGQQEMGSKVEDQQEMGSKEEDQQKMGSKIEGQQEMGSKIEGQQEMGSKIEGQQEMGSKEEDQQKMGSKVEDQQKMGSKVEDQQVLSEVEDQQEVGLKVEGRQEVGSEGEDQQNMGSKDQNQQKTRSKVEDYIETTVADQEEAYKGDSGERDGQKLVHELDALKQ